MPTALSLTNPLTLMISSRCTDLISFNGAQTPMSALRAEMKRQLEAIRLGGKQVYSVWIHEDESNGDGSEGNWEACLDRARRADVFIALYNGRAGWLGDSTAVDGVGICHAELSAAYDKAPAKVRALQFTPLVKAKPGSTDAAFQDYMARLKISAAQVSTGEQALKRADELAAAVVLGLARTGVGHGAANRYFSGDALEWCRMNFEQRRHAMTTAMVKLIRAREPAGGRQPGDSVAAVGIRDTQVAFVCDAVPASMSTPAARELVGQPFLKDHELTRTWEQGLQGPVHVIACQKNVTETQAVRMLGFPDAIVVTHPFGIYVADDVQKIQLAFIANCRDETTTQLQVQTFLHWLNDHGEMRYLVERARGRRRLSDFIQGLSVAPAPSASPAPSRRAAAAKRAPAAAKRKTTT